MRCDEAGRFLSREFDGELSDAERRALERHLDACAACRRLAGELAVVEELAGRALTSIAPLDLGLAPLAARVRGARRVRQRNRFARLAAAAAAAALLGAVLGLARRGRAENEVLGGDVIVGGARVARVPEGARLRVAGETPAILRLADGSRAELATGSEAVLSTEGEGARQVVALDRGRGAFKVERQPGLFEVRTPVGTVRTLGTEFSVELRPAREAQSGEGGETMSRKAALVLAVAVAAGRVSVEFDGKTHTLAMGDSRVFAAEGGEGERGLPESVRGFSGQVRGVVVAKGEKHTFTFRVGRVLRTWEGNKARRPNDLAGLTVRVGPRWVKGERGKWHPVELHVLFIRKLQAGHEMTIEIRNVEGEHFQILELSAAQREWARREGEGEREGDRPRDGEGEREGPRDGEGEREGPGDGEGERLVLSEGPVQAVVTCVVLNREKAVVHVQVEALEGRSTWKSAKGEAREMRVGEKSYFAAQWEKGEGGNWRPARREMAVVERLKPGMRIRCGAYFQEHPRLRWVEILGRAAGEGEGEGRRDSEGERGDREGEGEREGADVEPSALPETVRGFSGQVRGVVVAKRDKHVFLFRVGRVLRTWEGNKARRAEDLAGLTVRVGPRWVKGKRGKWHPVELHVLFIRKLRAGQELTLEIHNVERDHFAILELSGEQREWARKDGGEGERREGERREEEKPPPDDAREF